MKPLTVATWNVLHRVHAENWGESPVALYPDERTRALGVARAVAGLLEAGCDAVCLQEVSGDQRAALAALPGVAMVVHTYPRVPQFRVDTPTTLSDPREHLVILARQAPTLLGAHTNSKDPGKGQLVAEVRGARLVCTHVAHGRRGREQLAAIRAEPGAEPLVVCGDFNAHHDQVAAELGPGFSVSELEAGAVTRIPTGDKPGHVIDFVAARGAHVRHAYVVESDLSDHLAVVATIAD